MVDIVPGIFCMEIRCFIPGLTYRINTIMHISLKPSKSTTADDVYIFERITILAPAHPSNLEIIQNGESSTSTTINCKLTIERKTKRTLLDCSGKTLWTPYRQTEAVNYSDGYVKNSGDWRLLHTRRCRSNIVWTLLEIYAISYYTVKACSRLLQRFLSIKSKINSIVTSVVTYSQLIIQDDSFTLTHVGNGFACSSLRH